MADLIVGAVPAYITKEYAGAFSEHETTISVQTTVTKLLDNDPERPALLMVNLGANDVYVKPNNTPGVEAGILLAAFGGSISLTVHDDLTLPARNWYGIADTAASDVYVVYVQRYKAD